MVARLQPGRFLVLTLIAAATAGFAVQACSSDSDPVSPPVEEKATTPDDTTTPDATAPDAATPDAAAPDATAPDATTPDAGPACDTTKLFGAPAEVTELNVYDEQGGARLSADMKTVYFHAKPSTSTVPALFQATRATASAPFGAPQALAIGNADAEAMFPTVAADGLSIYFETNRNGSPVAILFATRATVSVPFGTPAAVTNLTDPANTGQPYLAANGTMYFSSRHAGGAGGLDIYRTEITAPGVASASGFVPITELNTAGSEDGQLVSADGLTLYFARNDVGDGGVTAYRYIWSATRASKADPFSNPTAMAGLSSASGDSRASWISPDACTLYLSQGTKIFSATRPK